MKRSANNRFRRGSAAFECRHCGRLTRDTTGDNGSVTLCEDCYDGCSQQNGMNDSGDPALAAQYERDMRACFQRAVNRGGKIEGYAPIVDRRDGEPHQLNLDAAQRELDARNAQGEDVSMYRVNPQTCAIERVA